MSITTLKNIQQLSTTFNINNRRYIGSKFKLVEWIQQIIIDNCQGNSFCDLFAGTGIVTHSMLQNSSINHIIMNDILFSNHIIYRAFFDQGNYDINKLIEYKEFFTNSLLIEDNYVSTHFGDKFFSINNAKHIGSIRQKIEDLRTELSYKEYCILLASLIYSVDKAANTVGHFDAYIKKGIIKDSFKYELITPIQTDKEIIIHRQDANTLAQNLQSDIVYIDPPYNSRQYSRFYHVLENIVKWEQPKLYGVALKPEPENMSEYSRCKAPDVFNSLIHQLQCNHIVVSYNNTYIPKSNSSRNKIEYNTIIEILESKGQLTVFDKQHRFFSTGKTDFKDHKEFLFVVKVRS